MLSISFDAARDHVSEYDFFWNTEMQLSRQIPVLLLLDNLYCVYRIALRKGIPQNVGMGIPTLTISVALQRVHRKATDNSLVHCLHDV